MTRISSLFKVGAQQCCAPIVHGNWQSKLLGVLLGFTLLGAQGAVPLHSDAAELSDIQERGYLIVAVKDNRRPLGFQTAEGQLVGLEIDIAHRLAEELLGDRNAITFIPVNNSQRLPMLLNDEVDLVIAGVTATGSRARLVDFSPPYYLDGTAFVTRDAAVERLTDLAGQRIAVLNNSSTIAVVRSLLPTVRLVGVSSYEAALTALEADQATAFAADASILSGWVQEYPEYRLLPTLISAEALCVVMPKGLQYTDLRERVNQAIAQWQLDGWLQERIEVWGLLQ